MKVEIKKVPLVKPNGETIGEEIIVENCPRFCAKVNVKKSCAKCPAKISLSYKEMTLDCKKML